MEEFSQDGREQSEGKASVLAYRYVVAVILLIPIAIGGFLLYQRMTVSLPMGGEDTSIVQDSGRGVQVADGAFRLSGSLLLSLVPTDKSRQLNIYTYDMGTAVFKMLPFAKGVNITAKVSPDGTQAAFARHDINDIMQIFTVNQQTRTIRQISTNQVSFKREPIWSHDGKSLAYVGYSTGDERNPDTWRVYVVDLAQGAEKFVINGYNPIFSPDDSSLLVLKDNGLHLVNLSDKSNPEKIQMPVGRESLSENTHAYMKLSMSPDGKLLAWSDSRELPSGTLTVFDIASWKPFTIKVKKQINGFFLYHVFSPDSRYLAVEAMDEGPDGKFINARVMVYDTDSFASEKVLNLVGFDVSLLWLTDWFAPNYPL